MRVVLGGEVCAKSGGALLLPRAMAREGLLCSDGSPVCRAECRHNSSHQHWLPGSGAVREAVHVMPLAHAGGASGSMSACVAGARVVVLLLKICRSTKVREVFRQLILRAAADAAELSWDGMSGARESRGRLC